MTKQSLSSSLPTTPSRGFQIVSSTGSRVSRFPWTLPGSPPAPIRSGAGGADLLREWPFFGHSRSRHKPNFPFFVFLQSAPYSRWLSNICPVIMTSLIQVCRTSRSEHSFNSPAIRSCLFGNGPRGVRCLRKECAYTSWATADAHLFTEGVNVLDFCPISSDSRHHTREKRRQVGYVLHLTPQ